VPNTEKVQKLDICQHDQRLRARLAKTKTVPEKRSLERQRKRRSGTFLSPGFSFEDRPIVVIFTAARLHKPHKGSEMVLEMGPAQAKTKTYCTPRLPINDR